MKIFFEFLPILAFFVAFKTFDIYVATSVAIGITVIQMLWLVWKKLPISKMQIINFFIILIFGSLTIILHDKEFIMLKPTVLYWTFAFSLAVSFFVFKKNLLQMVLGKELVLDTPNASTIWSKINLAWIIYFAFLGFLNLYVAKFYSEDTWVNFKLSTIGLLLVFLIFQGLWLSRYIKSDTVSK
jgi:intracellular septation protein